MLAHFGPLHEESLGGTRQRVLLEAEAQSLASNALRDSQQDPWPRSLDRDTAQNTPQVEKIATSRTKKPHSTAVPFSHSRTDTGKCGLHR